MESGFIIQTQEKLIQYTFTSMELVKLVAEKLLKPNNSSDLLTVKKLEGIGDIILRKRQRRISYLKTVLLLGQTVMQEEFLIPNQRSGLGLIHLTKKMEF